VTDSARTDDHVGHRAVGPHWTAVVDLPVDVFGDEGGLIGGEAVGVPLGNVPAVEAEFAGNHLLGEVALRDEQRDDVDLVALDGAEHFSEVRLLFQKPVFTSSKAPVARIVSAWSYVGASTPD